MANKLFIIECIRILFLLSTFLTVNAHLGAGGHQQAIQRDLWKGQRNYLTMHNLGVRYKYSHSSRCIHISISFLTELQHKNIFSITKKTLQSHEIIIVSALKKKERRVDVLFCDDDDLIIDTRELCNHANVFPLGYKEE